MDHTESYFDDAPMPLEVSCSVIRIEFVVCDCDQSVLGSLKTRSVESMVSDIALSRGKV